MFFAIKSFAILSIKAISSLILEQNLEIAVSGTPALFINAVGGCETYNCNFFVNKGSAKTATKLDSFIQMTLSSLEGDLEFEKAAAKIKSDFSESSSEKIVAFYMNVFSKTESDKK